MDIFYLNVCPWLRNKIIKNSFAFRTKIQAQRKFAHGQQPPSSAYLTYNLATGSDTIPKEKSQEKELLPNLRPNTEDFLTFLCFRGTKSLPKELNFQNKLGQTSNSVNVTSVSNNCHDKKQKICKVDVEKTTINKTETVTCASVLDLPKQQMHLESSKDPKTGFMPFAVRKRAEVYPMKSDKKKSLFESKKKQQDFETNNVDSSNCQKITRNVNSQKASKQDCMEKTPKTAVTRSRTESPTNSGHNIHQDKTTDKHKKIEHDKTVKKIFKKSVQRQTRLTAAKNVSLKMTEEKQTLKSLKHVYSSSDDDDDDNEPLLKLEPSNKKPKLQDCAKPLPTEKKENMKNLTMNSNINRNLKKGNSDRQKHKNLNKTLPGQIVRKRYKSGGKNNFNPEMAPSQANTTDLSENEARGRPMRKTKEAATIYMELIGRKLTLRDSSDNDSSLDSLEVPNLKRVELLENELKANCEKAKEAKAEKHKLGCVRVCKLKKN